jgi:hypothetical protein
MHTRAQESFRSHGVDIALDYAADRNGREVAQPIRQVADIMSISFIADCRREAAASYRRDRRGLRVRIWTAMSEAERTLVPRRVRGNR